MKKPFPADPEAEGAIVAARGFRAVGLGCGIKPQGLDLALLVGERAVPAAAVFTSSLAAAPPVQLSRRHLAQPYARAVLATSGCANAGTGAPGLQAAEQSVSAVAAQLGCAAEEVLVCSTGLIGPRLPVEKIVAALPQAVAGLDRGREAGRAAAAAICTTDSRSKQSLRRGGGFVVGGMAKGAGMICPDMATMLAFITTDAVVDPARLARSLHAAVAVSFNSLNVDACQSTNDTVMVLASGAAAVEPTEAEFTALLREVCCDLAFQIAADAEGTTRVVRLRLRGATDDAVARKIGKHVASSDLVRAALWGGDPNWGRILAALGTAGVPLDCQAVEIDYAGVPTCRAGAAVPFDDPALAAQVATGDFAIDIRVGTGPGCAEVLTADLTPDYVVFNGERS
ncbi:MAG: bifunctional glutamate N-acetyltransferase/amino-acid acetyltransferase ArgJ [Proteobacteria bacterium]|nr:bifunctional glutamate N-acetyltransferase/amino-acid acetyltransferase ArgJ [Pseudomonadota bacterium]